MQHRAKFFWVHTWVFTAGRWCGVQTISFSMHSWKTVGGKDTYNKLFNRFPIYKWHLDIVDWRKIVVMPPLRRRNADQYLFDFDWSQIVPFWDWGLSYRAGSQWPVITNCRADRYLTRIAFMDCTTMSLALS